MTSPGRYSAGTAFLDVVPSFRGVQTAIAREARKMEAALGKDAGDAFGKSFEESATKAVDKALGTTKAKESAKKSADEFAGAFQSQLRTSMAKAQSALGGIKIEAEFNDTKARNEFNALKKNLERLTKVKIGTEMDAGPAFIVIQRLEQRLQDLQDKSPNIDARVNFGRALAEIEAFKKRIQKDANFKVEVDAEIKPDIGRFRTTVRKQIAAALENLPTAKIDANTDLATREIAQLRKRLFELSDREIGVDLNGAAALAEAEALRVAFAEMAQDKTIDIKVRAEAAGAAAELLELRKIETLIDGSTVEIKAKADTKDALTRLQQFKRTVEGTGADGETSANAFRAFNFAILGLTTILPAAIPLLVAAAGATLLLGAAGIGVAAGLGVLALGFGGITGAVQAMGNAQDSAGRESEASAKRIRSASRGVEDASRGVSRAVEGQADAERNLVRAQQDVVRAQEAVTRAREEARERIEDLALSVEGGALAEERAVMRLTEAREEYEAALEDPGATAKERAELLLSYKEEDLALRVIQERNGDLGAEQAEVARTGIDGAREVTSAQEQLAQAQEGVQQALRGVGDAARGVEDAQRNLTQAQEDYNTALFETSASTEALEVAMGKLGPAGQAFATFINDLRGPMRELRDAAQAGILPGVQSFLTALLITNGPLLRDFVTAMGAAIGAVFTQLGELLSSPQWQAIFGSLTAYAPIFMTQFGQIGMSLLTFFGELFKAFAPYAVTFGDALVAMSAGMAEWAASLSSSQGFQDFMAWLATNGPLVWDVVKNVAAAIINLVIALEPLGLLVLGVIDNFAQWIAGMDPETLGTIVTVVLGLVIAFQLANGALALLIGTVGILSSPVTAIIFVIGAAVTALIALYTQSEEARKIMDAVFTAIGEVVSFVWTYVLKPILTWIAIQWLAMATAVLWVWEHIFFPVWDALVVAAKWAWEEVLKPVFGFIGDAWNALATGFAWAYENIIKPMWDALMIAGKILLAVVTVVILGPMLLAWTLLAEGFQWAWKHLIEPMWEQLKAGAAILFEFLEPLFKTLGEIWEAFATGMKWIYDNVIYPYIIQPFKDAISDLASAFSTAVEAIGTAWNAIKKYLAMPVNFVIKWVLNEGLFAAFNWIVKTLHLPAEWEIKPLSGIQVDGETPGFAAGGKVPGWSPNDKADNIPAMLTAGEWVQPIDSVDYYGPDFMEAIRKKKIPRESLQYLANGGRVGGVQYLAPGGRVYEQMFAVIKEHFPMAGLNSGLRPGDRGYHGQGKAVDLGRAGTPGGSGNEYLALMNRWLYDNFRNSTELIYNGYGDDRPNLKNGRDFPYDAQTQKEHRNHVHWALQNAAMLSGAAGLSSPEGSSNGILDFFNSVGDVLGKLTGSISKLGEVAGGPILNIVKEIPKKMLGNLWEGIKDRVTALFDAITGSGDPQGWEGSDLKTMVRNLAAANYGWSSEAEWNALHTLIQKESSWNPNAQNPTSTAYGLFQFLNGTWDDVGMTKSANPAVQAQAGLKYIADRYGSPSKALAFHNRNNWYGEGGEVGASTSAADMAPTLYDTGGWLPPGITTVLNATNKPEPILTNEQWTDLTATEGGDERHGIRDLHLHQVQADLSEAIDEVNHWVSVYDKGGRYVGTD